MKVMDTSLGNYRLPTDEEKDSGKELEGYRISVYWDGDKVFYPAKIVSWKGESRKYDVVYDGSDEVYEEDLSISVWKILDATNEHGRERSAKREAKDRIQNDKVSKPREGKIITAPRLSYAAMVLEAVQNLGEKGGSTIQAIRKYIAMNYLMKQTQTASFNNLTLKALQNAVALNILEIVAGKRAYRISAAEKQRRKEQAKRDKIAATRVVKEEEMRKAIGDVDVPSSWLEDPFVSSLSGTAAAYNKVLRKELITMRSNRDKFLNARMQFLKPFLSEKNYFSRLAKIEEYKRIEKEKKRQQALEIKAQQQLKQDFNRMNDIYLNQPNTTGISVANAIPGNIVLPSTAENTYSRSIMDMQDPYSFSLSNHASGSVAQSGISYPSMSSVPLVEQISVSSGGIVHSSENAVNSVTTESEVNGFSRTFAGTSAALIKNEMNLVEKSNSSKAQVEEQYGTEQTVFEKQQTLESRKEGMEEFDDQRMVYSTMEGVNLIPQPQILCAELHEHQIQGISWMVHMFENGMPMLLGDQMGLGKTIQSIGFLAYLHHNLKKKGPYLVVVPLSVLSNWIAEFERFCPSFRAVRFHGPRDERQRIKTEELGDLRDFDVVVTTYEILVSEINFFKRKYVWTAVIIDEGHRLKNEKSQFSDKLRGVPTLSKIILTGTPLQNNLRELWAMLHYLAPDIFVSSKPFEDGFDLSRGHIDNTVLRKARKLLSIFMLRRLKDNVNIKLPSRKELTLLVPLTEQQNELYRQMLCSLDSSTLEVVMRDASGANRDRSDDPAINSAEQAPISSSDSEWRRLMNLLLQLRKVCNHTYLLPDVAPDPYEIGEGIIQGSGKLMMLDRMLPMLRADGHRVLLFSQFTSMLDILEDYCELRNYQYVRLDGETNRVKRRLDVRRFNAPNSQLFIFLISTRAGGLGLNLASADTVILYDSDWNPQVDLQAMERAHRIGQKKPVRVYRLVCRGSVEERMVSRAEKKLFLNAMVAETDPDEELYETDAHNDPTQQHQTQLAEALGIAGSSISKGELASLIRFGANAVFESNDQTANGNGMISDSELEGLLERQGRDRPRKEFHGEAEPNLVWNSDQTTNGELERAQQALKDRMEKLKEIDIRQLGTTVFATKKRKVSQQTDMEVAAAEAANSIAATSDGKRKRKQRVVMVDGQGTGYGGAVPVLASNIEEKASGNEELLGGCSDRSRGRQWSHMTFCILCGRTSCRTTSADKLLPSGKRASVHNSMGDKSDSTELPTIKCSHCPFIFHQACFSAVGRQTLDTLSRSGNSCNSLTRLENMDTSQALNWGQFNRPLGMFICPHHKCGYCSRSTGAAGGLLFRCIDCLTAYCEDCLPQDEIDSVGRCRELESYGYESKQAYFIKCPNCCKLGGKKPIGMLGQNTESSDNIERNIDNSIVRNASKASLISSSENGRQSDGGTDLDELEEAIAAASAEEAPTEGNYDESDNIELLSTQLLRLYWTEIPPTPEVDRAKSSKVVSIKKKLSESNDDDSDGSVGPDLLSGVMTVWKKIESRENHRADQQKSERIIIPSDCSTWEALQLLLSHPLWKGLGLLYDQLVLKDLVDNEESRDRKLFSQVLRKIEIGRYRSVSGFSADLRYVVEGLTIKPIRAKLSTRRERTRLDKLLNFILSFIDNDLTQNVVL